MNGKTRASGRAAWALPLEGRRAAWALLAAAVLLVIVYPTEPLFFQNQHTKFPQGLRLADWGHLEKDWLANTRDGLFAFTLIVRSIFSLGLPWLTYLVQAAIFGAFLWSLVSLFNITRPDRQAPRTGLALDRAALAFLAILVVTHADKSLSRVWEGVATQYILSPGLEPQNFGVFFLVSLVLFGLGRPALAFLAVIPAGAVHPGYVMPAAILLIAYLAADRAELRRRGPLYWLALVGAIAVFAGHTALLKQHFAGTTPELFARGTEILTQIRIPDHSNVSHWLLNVDGLSKTLIVGWAGWLTRRERVGQVILVAFAGVAMMTLIRMLTQSELIALISPWRASAWLVPAAMAILIGRLAVWIAARLGPARLLPLRTAWPYGLAALLLAAALVRGLTDKIADYGKAPAPNVAFLRSIATDDTVVLAPDRYYELRLLIRAPIYVSFKSHPYQDVEVIEWWRRVEASRAIYADNPIDCGKLGALAAADRITHVLVRAEGRTLDCPFAALAFSEPEGTRPRWLVYAIDLQ